MLAGAFEVEGLISTYMISVVPVVLGREIPLIGGHGGSRHLELTDVRSYESGLVQLTYEPANG